MATRAKTKPETKHLRTPFEVKDVDEGARTFEGLASTWDLDLGGDVIHRGAFKRTLDHWRQGGKVMPLIDQHNYGSVRSVVGKMTEATETKAGLDAEFEVIEGADGDEVLNRIKGGYVDGLSIGYRPVKVEMPTEEEEREGVFRHLKEVELREVSVVIWPMNPDARVDTASVKAMLDGMDAADLTDEQRAELKRLRADIDALLTASPDGDPPDGLAPDDPRRLAIDAKVRELTLRRLATR